MEKLWINGVCFLGLLVIGFKRRVYISAFDIVEQVELYQLYHEGHSRAAPSSKILIKIPAPEEGSVLLSCIAIRRV